MITMKTGLAAIFAASFLGMPLAAGDWPQWRGPHRDGKALDFTAPAAWPKQLSPKWKIAVGDGVATPALANGRLYVFSREGGSEVLRCLEAGSGKELWRDQYDALPADGPAGSFPGPRSSPAVAEGKVVTLGVRGMLSCWNAESGQKLWRKDDFSGARPNFFTASSPLILDGMCVAQLGGRGNGGIVAYDLNTGAEKWKWTGDGPAYASPVLLELGGRKLIVAQTDGKVVALDSRDGALAWETPFAVQGRGYNTATPIVDRDTIIYGGSGRGFKAVKLEASGTGFSGKELWANSEQNVQFNTPVLKDGNLYGLTAGNELFCIDAKTGRTKWTAPASANPETPPAGGRGRGRGGAGFGSIVDSGSVLMGLTPASELIVFKPGGEKFEEIARLKLSDSPIHAHPIPTGDRLFIKDKDSVMLLTLD